MSSRRQAAAAGRREAHHIKRFAAATTSRGEMWAAFGWLAAEAVRARRIREVTGAALALMRAVRTGQPLTDRVFDSSGRGRNPAADSPAVSTRAHEASPEI